MRWLHRWLGLWAGIPVAVVGLSGSLLVFRDDIERSARGVPGRVESLGRAPLPLQTVARQVLAAYPGARLLSFQIPAREAAPYELLLGPPFVMVAADPFTGAPLGVLRGDRRIWLAPVARLHFHPLLSILAVAMLTLAVSGFVLRSWRRDIHVWLGLAVSPFLLLFAVSGMMFHFARPAGVQPPAAPHDHVASLDDLAAAALAALPGARLSYLQMPDSNTAPVLARMRLPGELRAIGGNDVYLDPATARVLRVDRLEKAGRRRWYMNAAALHFGEFGGMWIRVAWAILGGAPLVLFLTRRR